VRAVSIAGPGSGCGKTALVEGICAAFPGRLTAVKFTTVAPDGEAPAPLDGAFRVLDDEDTLGREGSDTARAAAAGARRALWCVARPEAYTHLWMELRERHLAEDELLVTEGNTAAGLLCPDLLVFLHNPWFPREAWKDSAWRLLGGADVVVTNPYHPERGLDAGGAPEGVLDKVGRARIDALRVTADVSRPATEWKDPRFAERLRLLLG
jgi:hypothetical protein